MGKNTALNLVKTLSVPGNELLNDGVNGDDLNYEPIPENPPAHMKMTVPKKAIWKEIVSTAPEGYLHNSDCLIVEQAVHFIYEFRLQKKGGHEAWGTAKTKQLVAILNDLGLSPKGRTNLG